MLQQVGPTDPAAAASSVDDLELDPAGRHHQRLLQPSSHDRLQPQLESVALELGEAHRIL